MSQTNQTNEENKKRPVMYWLIIAILLIACIYFAVSKKQAADDNDAKSKQLMGQIDSVKTDRASLQTDFDAASAKIDQLVSQNSKLDSTLQKNQGEMDAMRAKIKSILSNAKSTKAELAQAREMIISLNDKSKQYEARIAELEKENTILTGKNQTLTKERDSTVTQNIAIKKVASVLHASGMQMEAIHVKKNGKEKETNKAKKANTLRIKWNIDENRIAESGTKQLYLRIIAPDASILSNPANGSGMMTTAKGDHITFSAIKEISLIKDQPVNDVTLDWHQDGDYMKGDYTIEIYSEGYKVGSGVVHLK